MQHQEMICLSTVLPPSRLLLSSVSVPGEFSSDPAHPIQQFEISVLSDATVSVFSDAAASTASETAESALLNAVLDPQPHSTDAHRSNKDSLFHDSSSLLIILRMECKRFSLFSELFNPSFPAGIRRHSVFLPPLPPR